MKTVATLFRVVSCSIVVAGCGGANVAAPPPGALTAAVDVAAPSIPAGYVVVPGAHVHPSCVFAVEDGAMVSADGTIVHADGRHEPAHAPCAYPEVTHRARVAPPAAAHGTLAPAAPVPTLIANGWVEEVSWYANMTVGYMQADWQVPNWPTNDWGQTVFYFPSLQHTGSNPAPIIQPVLQYGPSAAGGGAWSYALASWFGPIYGNYYHSGLNPAWPNDWIHGAMKGSSCAADHCGTWDIWTQNSSRGSSSHITYYGNPDGLWYVSGGVIEAYSIYSCSEFSKSGQVHFTNVHVRDLANNLVTWPNWWGRYDTNVCSQWLYAPNGPDVYMGLY